MVVESSADESMALLKVILSHAGADFDALASMVAARRLYPEARMFFTGSPEPNVREFVTLHRQHFPVHLASEYQGEPLELVVLVDTREPSRLGPFRYAVSQPDVQVHIYDHHPPTPEAIAGDLEEIERLGASVTVLLRKVREQGLPVEPLEATLYLLGLYEETGSLTFPGTTPEDVRMVAWLLEQGGNLALLPHFVQHSLSSEQRALMADLLSNARMVPVHGFQILLVGAETSEYVEELAVLSHRLMDLERPDVLFTAVRMGQRTYVVGRSAPHTADVGRIMGELGGGGHPTAASASLRDRDPWEVLDELLWIVEARLPRRLVARDLMSSPVECLDADGRVTVQEAGEFLQRIGHSAVCVREGGELVGMIARSDVDKALYHGLGHAPVQAYMIRDVVRVGLDDPLPEIQRVLVENDIGRVPVTDGPRLVGIVSRTDILRALHGFVVMPAVRPDPTPPQLLRLEPRLLSLLRRCGQIGEEVGFGVYAVGGFVRDLLLEVPNLDVDLVVEGNAIEYAEHLARVLDGRCSAHEKFGTAVVTLPDGRKLDVATARTEMYTRPAALPVVRGSTLKQDLYRRDFSVNAMALRLHPDHFGRLVDFFGAQRDLQSGVIRVLHNLSFIDDPTRIFRAIRFEQRFGFRMEPNTEHLLRGAVGLEVLSLVSPERVRDELMLILSESRPIPAILRMDRLKVLRLLHPGLQLDGRDRRILEEIEELLSEFGGLVRSGAIRPWLVYLNALLGRLELEDAEHVVRRYRFRTSDCKRLLLDRTRSSRRLRDLARSRASDSEIWRALAGMPLEACLYLAARSRSERVRGNVGRFLRSLRFVEAPLSGEDLRGMGYPPGPLYREILDWLRDERLDGRIMTPGAAREAVRARWPLPTSLA